jgi:hypothetical protein
MLHRKLRARPEDAEQIKVLDAVDTRGRERLFAFSIPVGGLRSKSEAVRLKAAGAVKGFPDLGFLYIGRAYFIEMKARTKGRVSDDQLGCHAAIRRSGCPVEIARGADEAIAHLIKWGLLN